MIVVIQSLPVGRIIARPCVAASCTARYSIIAAAKVSTVIIDGFATEVIDS